MRTLSCLPLAQHSTYAFKSSFRQRSSVHIGPCNTAIALNRRKVECRRLHERADALALPESVLCVRVCVSVDMPASSSMERCCPTFSRRAGGSTTGLSPTRSVLVQEHPQCAYVQRIAHVLVSRPAHQVCSFRLTVLCIGSPWFDRPMRAPACRSARVCPRSPPGPQPLVSDLWVPGTPQVL